MHCGEAEKAQLQRHRQTPEGLRSSPETPEARTDPAADSGPLCGNLQLGNTPRLWLSEVGYSWEKRFKKAVSLLKGDFSTGFGFDSIKNTTRMRVTILQSAPPSAPPPQPCSASQRSGPRGRRGPWSGPQTEPLWARWPSAGSVDF